MIHLLSADNYAKDGPNFVDSINYINKTKEQFNRGIDYLIQLCSEDSIVSYIKKKNLDDYYINLYKKLMFTDNMSNDFSDSRILLQDSKDSINELFINIESVFNYLIRIQGSWKVENGQILFINDEMVNQYNHLISKIQIK